MLYCQLQSILVCSHQVSTLAEYKDVEAITVQKENERMQKVVLHLKDLDNPVGIHSSKEPTTTVVVCSLIQVLR